METAIPPAPDGQVLTLVGALSNAQNHQLHIQAIQARDEALSSSPETYGNLCTQLAYLMAGADRPVELILQRMDPNQFQHFQHTDPESAQRLQTDVANWILFGQMAGLILKEALLHPPKLFDGTALYLQQPAVDNVKMTLLYCLGCSHAELRNVASTVLATTAVSQDGVQPLLSIHVWPELIDYLVDNLNRTTNNPGLIEGALSTVRKILEDGPHELNQNQLDTILPTMLKFLIAPSPQDDERIKTSALQAIVAIVSEGIMPSSLVAHFGEYLTALSGLAQDPSVRVRKWVCRSIVTLLSTRCEYLQQHMEPICQFMLNCTADTNNPDVALEACEFWLTFASLDEDAIRSNSNGSSEQNMMSTVGRLLPHLVPVLLRGMVYLPDQQQELIYRNQMERMAADQQQMQSGQRPVFHKIKAKGHTSGGDKYDEGDDDDDDDEEDDFDDEDGNSWTLRKCSAASLDCLASLYGPDGILPPLLPALQEGLSNADPWIQEASILALGAISEGCGDVMGDLHMTQLHPFLMEHLRASDDKKDDGLVQLKCIAAWTIGRYASWAVKQVQTGAQRDLLACMIEVFVTRMGDQNRRLQVSCCSALGVVIEQAGDLMIPYLVPTLSTLNKALQLYEGRSLLNVFDVFGIMADFVGQGIGEGDLPAIYVPTLLSLWDNLARHDPTDRTLVPLLECLASIALVCGTNFQPYALETFDNAMAMIESVTLHLAASDDVIDNEEDADPIVCATDVIDGLVEGLGASFPILLAGSKRYGQVFTNVLIGLLRHEVPGVRMSGFAVVGDLARNSPAVLEPALLEILQESIENLDPTHPTVCNNAVWAVGEICAQCHGNPAPLYPVAQDLVQGLVALLMGNGRSSGGVGIPGLAENASTTMGRLAKVDPSLVAADLPRFILGWCDGMARILDPAERRDAFQGFFQAVYANPHALQNAASSPSEAISIVLFAIVSWHLPEQVDSTGIANVSFQPFPPAEADLGESLRKLLQDIKSSAGVDTWNIVEGQLPANVRRLLREVYQV